MLCESVKFMLNTDKTECNKASRIVTENNDYRLQPTQHLSLCDHCAVK
jgi:hypothetical protein